MPHQLIRKANNTVEIEAHVDAAAVTEERSRILKTFRRRAAVPGFRPGKAPLQAVNARFNEEIESELKEELTGRLWREVLAEQENLKPITQPSFTKLELDDDGFSFTAEMEVRPRFELPELEGLTLPPFSLELADAEIDQELVRLQDGQAAWEPAEEDAVGADGLLAELEVLDEDDHHGCEDSEETSEAAAAEKAEPRSTHLIIGDDSTPPAFSEALQGLKVGDTASAVQTHQHGEGDDAHEHKVTSKLTVRGLKCKVLPPIDEDLAQTIGADSLEELKNRITEHLEHQKHGQRRDSWRRHLLDHLGKDIDSAEMPASLVNSAVHTDLNRFAYSLAMQGIDIDKAGIDWADIAAKGEPAARAKVLDNLILEQLADDWNVVVPEAQVEAHIRADANQRGIPPTEHKANLAKEDQLEDLRHAARLGATVDELIRRTGGEVD